MNESLNKYQRYESVRYDAIGARILSEYRHPIARADWTVEPYTENGDLESATPQNVEIANKVSRWLFNGEVNWNQFLRQAVIGRFEGCALFEKYWSDDSKKEKNLRRLAHIPPRDVVKWKTAKGGELSGVNIKLRVPGGELPEREVLAENLVRMTFNPNGTDDYEGNGLGEEMYPLCVAYRNLCDLYLNAIRAAVLGEPSFQSIFQNDFGILERKKRNRRELMAVTATVHIDPELFPERASDSTWWRDRFSHFQRMLAETAEVIRAATQRDIIQPLVDFNFPNGTPYPNLCYRLPRVGLIFLASNGFIDPTPEEKKEILKRLGFE